MFWRSLSLKSLKLITTKYCRCCVGRGWNHYENQGACWFQSSSMCFYLWERENFVFFEDDSLKLTCFYLWGREVCMYQRWLFEINPPYAFTCERENWLQLSLTKLDLRILNCKKWCISGAVPATTMICGKSTKSHLQPCFDDTDAVFILLRNRSQKHRVL